MGRFGRETKSLPLTLARTDQSLCLGSRSQPDAFLRLQTTGRRQVAFSDAAVPMQTHAAVLWALPLCEHQPCSMWCAMRVAIVPPPGWVQPLTESRLVVLLREERLAKKRVVRHPLTVRPCTGCNIHGRTSTPSRQASLGSARRFIPCRLRGVAYAAVDVRLSHSCDDDAENRRFVQVSVRDMGLDDRCPCCRGSTTWSVRRAARKRRDI
ncbi:hypothetical protein LXA43DRAFT_1051952 [Ganoderma leucocontextum]|nr:hypothetical protein LXA43DRAFT_1051952 [Ganoderma leucocontextum]